MSFEDNAPASPAAPTDVRSSIADAFSSLESADTGTTDTPQTDTSAADRARDEQGRFAPKTDDKPAAGAPKAAAVPGVTETDPPAAQASEAVKPPIQAPVSWSAEDKAVFAKLPPDAQAIVARRESERDRAIHARAEEVNRDRQRYQRLDQVLEPHRQEMQLAGMDEAMTVQRLLAVHNWMQRDAGGAIKWLAQSYGADLANLQAAPEAEQPYRDPQVATLTQKLDQITQHISGQQAAQTAQQQQALNSYVTNFATTKDEAGGLKFPHFDTVRQQMGVLIGTGQAQDMDSAYDMAVWARPDLRATLLQAQQQELQRKQQTEAAAAAKEAERAAASVRGAPGAAIPAAKGGSVRDELERNFARY